MTVRSSMMINKLLQLGSPCSGLSIEVLGNTLVALWHLRFSANLSSYQASRCHLPTTWWGVPSKNNHLLYKSLKEKCHLGKPLRFLFCLMFYLQPPLLGPCILKSTVNMHDLGLADSAHGLHHQSVMIFWHVRAVRTILSWIQSQKHDRSAWKWLFDHVIL